MDFLRSEIEEYEKGKAHFALKMAATLRTIFHRTKESTPILPSLANKYGIPVMFKGYPQSSKFGSIYLGFSTGNLRPCFDGPTRVSLTFADYWEEILYIEGNIQFSRRQLVRYAANKMGGCHVDPEIPDRMLLVSDGQVKLGSITHAEEEIITRAVYETGYQVLQVLQGLVPLLEKAIP
jgi:hypothetical protein